MANESIPHATLNEWFEEEAAENRKLRDLLAWAGQRLSKADQQILATRLVEKAIVPDDTEDDQEEAIKLAAKLEKLCDLAQIAVEGKLTAVQQVFDLDRAISAVREFTIPEHLVPSLREFRRSKRGSA